MIAENQGTDQQYLSVPQVFTYEYFQKNRYTISDKDGYECLCNNGFIKLYTLRTRVYWHAQNQFQHRVPDWKFHISVHHDDLKKAWDLLVGLFLRMKCRAGMKTIYLKQACSPQQGRQITLYIVKLSKQFENSAFASDYGISLADEHSQDYWYQMAGQIQHILSAHKIRQNGLAPGDLPIGRYISLRNQAFCLDQNGTYIYPPNQKGWNFQNHRIPLDINRLVKQIKNVLSTDQEHKPPKKERPLYYFTLPIMVVSIGLFCLQKMNNHPPL